ncbi:MAG: lysostaphin resistance A-like protein [Micrococcaceae bacterium]
MATSHTGSVSTVDTTRDRHALPTRVRLFRHPVTAVATVVLSMFTMIIGSGLISAGFYLLAAWITGSRAEGTLRTVLGIVSFVTTTVIAILLILLWRRLARLPMRGLGIVPLTRLWLMLPGFALAISVNYAAAALAVFLGASEWAPLQIDGLIIISVVTVFFGQAFPEELLWRGHLAEFLSHRVRPVAIIVITSVAFGAMHIVSGTDAQGIGEQLLYVLQATALGLLMIAMRFGTATLWAAVGFHTGYNVFFEVASPVPGSYGVELVSRALLLAACSVPLLIMWKQRLANAKHPEKNS